NDKSIQRISKLSYASSAGSYNFQGRHLKTLITSLKNFEAVSVRESSLRAQIQEYLSNVEVVLDPTFLLNKEEWNNIFNLESPELAMENYVIIYTFDNDPLCYETAKRISQTIGSKVYSITSNFFKNSNVNVQLDSLSPIEFLKYIYNARFVITNSFHGVCFSINFKKDFLAIRKGNNPVRVENLLRQFGLEGRLISTLEGQDSRIDPSEE